MVKYRFRGVYSYLEENWVKDTEKRIFYGMVKYSLEEYIHNWKKTGLKLQSREYSIEWLNIGFRGVYS